ncbi:PREDICTED: mucosa-associated lymphoid tissue lymphoma translocation protein 1-like, partial [Priapulus caudatus]|uniref:Mucosa-associated lymphoid tissue lymphoma translocation protein 1-like n=1 Tax=Priapulus caudatus TaxID=37621 RepID=A0ABM1F7J0_PRICU
SLKVALLIGNQDYEGLGRLHNPATDVETLARCLASLSFRVIALVNLTHAEMNNALNEFCSMLHEGAYGVFYYAGHGFKKDELSYMVPLETPHSAGDDGGVAGFSCDDCLCVQRALACMQETGAALNLLILDMCRAESR